MTAVSSHPLLAHTTTEGIVAWRHGRAISVAGFLGDVARVAAALPAGGHILNTCSDRYCFAVGLAATLVSGRTSLLPATLTREVARHLRAFAPDVVCLTDGDRDLFGLPGVSYPDDASAAPAPRDVPLISGERVVAWLFTSGTTGRPVPHQKTWGALVKNVRAEGELLGLLDGRRHAIVGTVPAQHMYGLESTVMVALQSGAAFSAARPLFPADICSAIAAVPRPRLLVTTPFHLRTLLDAGVDIPDLDLLLSATAPLSPRLAREAETRCRAPLLEIYGSTETGQIACRRPAETAEWRLFPGVRLAQRDGGVCASGGHVEREVALDDVLEITAPGRFLLHGRSADMINIAGKRSSLAYLNFQLCAVPGVVDGTFFVPEPESSEGVTRLTAIVVAPELTAAALKQALRERIEPAFLPRRVLFVAGLPRNATGKLPVAALRTLLAEHSNGSRSHPMRRETTITIAHDHPALAGHFPGTPIVPGVVLLDQVLHAIQSATGVAAESCRIASAKFFRPVGPGVTLTVVHETLANGAIAFDIMDGPRKVAGGSVLIQLAGAGSRE